MSNTSYRIRTTVGEKPYILNVNLKQSFDVFEILSLKLTQEDAYKLYSSSYGVVVGRVLANGGFGIQNAKVSIFIEVTDEDYNNNEKNYLYPYFSTSSTNEDGVRYNLLPDEKVNDCYQNVGTFPNKRFVLDNDTILEIYDKYWKYTTVTNQSGDYMIFGVPSGDQQLHVDIDLSDIGALSQRPRDMIYKGYNINQFESPNKFKQSTNLDSLSQIYSQNIGINVYPFWGDSSENEDNIAITRADIQISYEFEPTCVFIGSIVTDSGSNAIGKNCKSTDNNGKMDSLISGEGSIEMIRKTTNNTVEEFQIKGNRLIDGDGVWCYQIPMNLDYVKTDEYGNIVPTDDPTNGIPTRARVRFRFTLDESVNDATGRKRCKILVPNNPRVDKDSNGNEIFDGDNPVFTKTKEPDYEFGTSTAEESYRDLYWNKVYTVKSYIPRMQGSNSYKTREHSGIKKANYYGDNNPFPYNNISIKLNFIYRLICVLAKVIVYIIIILNGIISTIGLLPCELSKLCIKIFKWKLCPFGFLSKAIPTCIELSSEFCDDGTQKTSYFPGCYGCVWYMTKDKHEESMKDLISEGRNDEVAYADNDASSDSKLFTCIETELSQDNEVTSFNFHNDWVNGVLYAPLWYRKITPKKSFLFGLIKLKAKDQWCDENKTFNKFSVYKPCDLLLEPSTNEQYYNEYGELITPFFNVNEENNSKCYDLKCHEKMTGVAYNKGLIISKQTILGQTVYYYASSFYSNELKDVVLLYATDIVLLGSLNDCDLDGVPQFFKYLEPSTYKLPTLLVFTNTEITLDGENIVFDSDTEASGCDWALYNSQDQCDKFDGGLFYGIGCSGIDIHAKSCVNVERACELNVSLDESYYVRDLNNSSDSDSAYSLLVSDGFVSKDELQDDDARSMFSTMNYNSLKTELNPENGLYKYKFISLYPINFDGRLYNIMKSQQERCNKTYRYNYNLEQFDRDYYKFRMGKRPFYYYREGNLASFPRYENSFYFYFGLKSGKTAIEKFNSDFFGTCTSPDSYPFMLKINTVVNSWCGDNNGAIMIELQDISVPYSIIVNGITDGTFSVEASGLTSEKICIGMPDADDYPDYAPIDTENINGIDNGEYEITVTDSNGNIMQEYVTLTPKYLQYTTDSVPFKIPNNILIDTYGSYNSVRNEKLKSEEISNNLGGHIIITNVYAGTDKLCPIGSTDSTCERFYTIEVYKTVTSYTFDESGNQITNEEKKYLTLTNEEIISGKIECDQGGVVYTVTLIEVCEDGTQTNNKVSINVNVKEPTPVKLYINDVDYDLIKKFKSGWKVQGGKLVQDPGSFCGWDKIGDVNNEYYNFGDDINSLSPEEQEEAKKELIQAVKDAFWITCDESFKTLEIRMSTDYYPVNYGIAFNEETIEYNEDNDRVAVVDSNNITITSSNTVSDIFVPTLLSKTSDNSGSIVNNFAKLNSDKIPYLVCGIDSNGTILPINANMDVSNIESSNIENWFMVHLIDKIFSIKYVCWAGVQNPVYFENEPSNWSEISVSVYSGFIRGIINNGVANNELKLIPRKWYDSNFEQQTINGERILIETITTDYEGNADENAVPTERRIIGNQGSRFGFPMSESDYDTTAADVPLKTSTLIVDDGTSICSINETLYGAMSINCTESLNDCSNNEKYLYLTTVSGDSDNRIMYYVIPTYSSAYPYPNHDIFNGSIYESGVTTEMLQNESQSYGIGSSGVYEVNDNGEEIYTSTMGYGNSGQFINITGTPTVYVVAVTNNNCRAISSVYDFRNVYAYITFVMEYEEADTEVDIPDITVTGTTTDSESGESVETSQDISIDASATTMVKKYRVKVVIEDCQQWYILNYNSSLRFTCNYIQGQPFSSSVDVDANEIKGTEIIIDISESTFFQIMDREIVIGSLTERFVPKDEEKLIKSSTVEITDVSGMVTRCKISYKN